MGVVVDTLIVSEFFFRLYDGQKQNKQPAGITEQFMDIPLRRNESANT